MTGLWFSQQAVSEVGGGVGCVVEGATGVASAIRRYQLPPCLIEPMPASSKMHPLPTKAKPISAVDSTSGITELRTVGNSCATDHKRNSPAGMLLSCEGKQ